MVTYLNDDILEVRRRLLNAVGKLNRVLDYTGYKNEQSGTFVGLHIYEFSPDEIDDIYALLSAAQNIIAGVDDEILGIQASLLTYKRPI